MCGIVGYIGGGNAVEVIQEGLRRLEYRGYDSAGVAVLDGGELRVVKSEGKLMMLDEKLRATPLRGAAGIGHTRWATHGVPSEANAHPHFDEEGRIALVHNGIIENCHEIRDRLVKDGVTFRSETDTETLVHLVRAYYNGDLFEAVKRALREVEGSYAIAVICQDEPGVLVAARNGSPLILGAADDASYIASDVPAIMNHTRKVVYLDNGQVCRLESGAMRIETLDGSECPCEVSEVEWEESAAEKDGYPHFMLKEIHQQPEVLRGLLRLYANADTGEVHFPHLGLDAAFWREASHITVVSCGTAWHAGLFGKYLLERYAGVPVEVDVSSEFRYRHAMLRRNTVVVAISQSGETADTLEAIRIARRQGAKVVSIVNVVGSSIARESEGLIYTHAGPEIGVASTKAYTSQLMALSLFALYLGRLRGAVSNAEVKELLAQLGELPDKVEAALKGYDALEGIARNFKYIVAHSALYLGRTFNYPTALEGALKLKEISYIHAEGYAAGEMKHGPIALVTDAVPSICVAVKGEVYDKMVSNMQEIRARRGIVLAIATEGDAEVREYADEVIYVPACAEAFSPIVTAIPIQLFAYEIATKRGCDVDQPRNLAKSVTVE